MALIDNISSYWKFDESSGDASDSVGSITLTNNGSAAYATGLINNGADLEQSSNNYFSRADGDLEPAGSFSYSYWIKPESLPGSGAEWGLWGKWNSTGNQRSYVSTLYNNAGTHQISAFIAGDGINNVGAFANSGMSTGNWYHIVYIFTASTSLELYVNNSRIINVTTSVPAAAFNSSAEFRAGDFVSSGGLEFDGLIDEMGYWSKALSSAEVSELYNAGAGFAYPFTTPSTFIPRVSFIM